MPLGTEVDLGPGDIVLDGDPAPPPTQRGTGHLCCFRHISASGLGVVASRASFIAVYCNLLHQISSLSTIIGSRVTFSDARGSPTLFLVLPKPEVV